MGLSKHTSLSILLLIMVFVAGVLAGTFLANPDWMCPKCSFSDADAIAPLINDQYAEGVIKEINSAESSIDIIMYQMKSYDSNNSVAQLEKALIARVKEGVSVRVLLDNQETNGKPTSLTKENLKTKAYLEENGIKVFMDSAKTTTHDKLLIIDGKVVVIGSHNWSFSAFESNNEASVIIKDPEIAAYYKNYFENLWEKYH